MPMHESPLVAESAVDVRHPDCHRAHTAVVYGDLAALEPNGVRKIAALESNRVLGNEGASFEAATNPAERIDELPMTLFDGSPCTKERHVFQVRPAVDIRLWIPR